jgi:hypothetical protein
MLAGSLSYSSGSDVGDVGKENAGELPRLFIEERVS